MSWQPVTVACGILSYMLVTVLSPAQEPPAQAPREYKILRFEEDYSYLQDPTLRKDFWDPIKFIPLRNQRDWYLSLGGEARERYEIFDNSSWGAGPQDDDGYLLQRYLLHTDLHLGDSFRFFGQLQSSLEDGRTGGARPTDEDQLDVHQAFVDVKLRLGDETSLILRGGRQELLFGSSRIVGVRDSPNVRLSFDGGRLTASLGDWRIDGFLTKPVEIDPGIFDDGLFADDRTFWGVYGSHTLPFLPGGNLDLYYLGLNRPNAEFDQGTADERRHSIGARFWGRPGGWDYNFEGVFQWGRFGSGDIEAWTVASDTGYTFASYIFQPRVGLKADIISGDRQPNDRDLETFNPLFPRGAYFGEIALIGPANLIDLHPSVDLHPLKQVSVSADCDVFWRESLHDGIYGNGVNVIRSGATSRARYIGAQTSGQVEWKVNRHFSISSVYAHFFAGSFIKETGPGRDVDFVGVWVTYRF